MRGRQVVVGVLVAAVGGLGLLPPSASAAVDTTPPVLRGVQFVTTDAAPGAEVGLVVEAVDDVGVVKVAVVEYEETSFVGYTVSSVPGRDPLRPAVTVTGAWPDGTHRISAIRLTDAAGNESRYYRSGSYVSVPTSTTRTHDVDLRTPSLTVSGGSDLSPPVLESVTLARAAQRAGDSVMVSWSMRDDASALGGITFVWRPLDSGRPDLRISVPTTFSTATAAMAIPDAGRWTLAAVEVVDARGNTASYDADGALVVRMSSLIDPQRHSLRFTPFDMHLAPGTPKVRFLERPGQLTVIVSGDEYTRGGVDTYLVSASPAGVTREVASRATAPFTDRVVIDLPNLPTGVPQTVTVRARNAAGLSRATAGVATPRLSANVHGVPDLDGDRVVDVAAQRQEGADANTDVLVYRGTGGGGLRAGTVMRRHGMDITACRGIGGFVAAPGIPMVLCWYEVLDGLTVSSGVYGVGGRGWSELRFVDGGFDLNGDRTTDVIAVDPAGQLRLYAQKTSGGLIPWPRIGTGWDSMISVISAGDLTGDRKNDIAAVDASGRLWLYPGNGKGGVTARKQIGSGWHQMGALLPLRDFDGDGKTDLGGITPAGDLRLYRGTGTGGLRNGVVIGTGWDRYL